jgi:S-adenosylmethionine synthetase
MGEVRSSAYIDLQAMARRAIEHIGYTKAEYQFDYNSCGILTAIHEQAATSTAVCRVKTRSCRAPATRA